MIRTRIWRAILCAVWSAASSSTFAAQQAVDTSQLGPLAGSTIPAFAAPDQFGRTQTLETVMGSNGVMLVFFRSADW